MFLTNNLYAWADEFLNIQLLQLVVFNLIFEDNVYKLFHSICSVKLCFVFFLSLPCIGGTKKTKKHTNCACFLDKQLVLMSKGIFGKPHFYSQQFIDWSPRMMHTFPRIMYTSCFIPYIKKSLCLVFFLALSCIGGTKKIKKHTNFLNVLDKQLVRMG